MRLDGGASLRVAWGAWWPCTLDVLDGTEGVGEVFRTDDRTVLEVEGREWWARFEGARVLRGLVTDPEGERLMVFAGSVVGGLALTRRGRELVVDVTGGWRRWRPVPGGVRDVTGRSLVETAPAWESGFGGWSVRTASSPDGPVALALWCGLVLERWRHPWLALTTRGVSPERARAELEWIRSEPDS